MCTRQGTAGSNPALSENKRVGEVLHPGKQIQTALQGAVFLCVYFLIFENIVRINAGFCAAFFVIALFVLRLRAFRVFFASFIAALLRCVRFLCCAACVFSAFCLCGKSREGKRGAPGQKDNAGETTMGLSPPLVLSGQMRAAGYTHDPRFLSGVLK